MEQYTVWWLLAGGAVALELATGTFYLLMLAIGLAAAAIAAHLGAGLPMQLLTAAVVGSGAVLGWHLVRGKRPDEPPAHANRDVNLDIGETVQIEGWSSEGTAVVRYRGSNWTAVPASGSGEGPGPYRVREVVGSRLVVERI